MANCGFPLLVLCEDRCGWSHRHVVTATGAERALSTLVGAEISWLSPRRTTSTMVQSIHYGDQFISAGSDPERVVVRTLGIEGESVAPRPIRPITVGFISTKFEEKGGMVVLAAFQKLPAAHPDARLVIVGSGWRPGGIETLGGSVTWMGNVTWQLVLDEGSTGLAVRRVPGEPFSGG